MSDENRGEAIGTPWWVNSMPADYTQRRTGAITWTVDDKIGRKDVTKWTLTTSTPADVTGTPGSILKG